MPERPAAQHSSADEWNVVVTAHQGMQRRLRRALRSAVRLQPAGFRNVLVGRIDTVEDRLDAVAELIQQRPAIANWMGKLLPVDLGLAVHADSFMEDLCGASAHLLDRLAGRSFHVRVERRGHKGTIHTQATERALGESLYTALQARAAAPKVTFTDPDVIVAVEIIGDRCGVALITRERRTRFPFVKID